MLFLFSLPDPPSAPKNLKVKDHRHDKLRLSWAPPDSDGGAPIRRYIIEAQCDDDKDFRPIGKVDGKSWEWEAIGLQKGKNYLFRVRAENPVGCSEECAELDEPLYTGPVIGKNILSF